MKKHSGVIRPDRLADYVLGLAAGKAQYQFECCVWIMMEQGRGNNESLWVIEGSAGDDFGRSFIKDKNTPKEHYTILWENESVDVHDVRNSIDYDAAAELGAEAIALLLAVERTEHNGIQRARKRGGYDYWIGKRDGHLFQQKVRLEVSGIGKGMKKLPGRVKEKLLQVSKSDEHLRMFAGCVIVIEFDKLFAAIIWK